MTTHWETHLDTIDPKTSEHLKSLHTALIDTRDGYRAAIERSTDPEASGILRIVDALHADAHGQIHGILAGRGVELDEDGSIMGGVHKAVVAVRSAIVGLDESSLSSFASGEDNNLETYDEAIRAERDENPNNACQPP